MTAALLIWLIASVPLTLLIGRWMYRQSKRHEPYSDVRIRSVSASGVPSEWVSPGFPVHLTHQEHGGMIRVYLGRKDVTNRTAEAWAQLAGTEGPGRVLLYEAGSDALKRWHTGKVRWEWAEESNREGQS